MSELLLKENFAVDKGDFASAGDASAKIKNTLKKLGIDPTLVRRIAIASYEVELNIIIHSEGGTMALTVTPQVIELIAKDRGPGIPNIDLAMKEGYSTAPDSVRDLGFGAGMGLPNMKRNSDDFHIESHVGEGTHITMRFGVAEN